MLCFVVVLETRLSSYAWCLGGNIPDIGVDSLSGHEM